MINHQLNFFADDCLPAFSTLLVSLKLLSRNTVNIEVNLFKLIYLIGSVYLNILLVS